MNPLDKPLHLLRAADLMTRDLVLIPEDMPLAEAARRLVNNQVSGAPVVDFNGALVGVISAADFLAQVTHDHARSTCPTSACVYAEWQVVDVDQLPEESVHCHMTADPVFASGDASVAELARMMVDAHVHRVIIVDSERRPEGIVTSTDILAAVARLEEAADRGDLAGAPARRRLPT